MIVSSVLLILTYNNATFFFQVLLLSLTAGGVGLNLVGANHLLLVDIHWNPQLENQACDRIYRVGQKKDVFIYRYVELITQMMYKETNFLMYYEHLFFHCLLLRDTFNLK